MPLRGEENNGYIELNGMKGIWTLNEIIDLLQAHNLRIKVVMSPKDSQHQSRANELSTRGEDRR